MCGSWDMKCSRENFLSSWAISCPFNPTNNQKNQNVGKMKKKTPGDIIILYKCTKNHYHMLYYSWDMACDRCNYLSFWAIFTLLPLPPHPISPKNQIKKKMKKTLEDIIILHVPNIMIRWCMASEIWCAMYGWTDGRADFFTFIKTLNI